MLRGRKGGGISYRNQQFTKEAQQQETNKFPSQSTVIKVIDADTLQIKDGRYEKNYETDRFGHLNAYVFFDNQNFNIELVKNGLAEVVIYDKRRPWKYQENLLTAQDLAKQQKIGIWSTLVK